MQKKGCNFTLVLVVTAVSLAALCVLLYHKNTELEMKLETKINEKNRHEQVFKELELANDKLTHRIQTLMYNNNDLIQKHKEELSKTKLELASKYSNELNEITNVHEKLLQDQLTLQRTKHQQAIKNITQLNTEHMIKIEELKIKVNNTRIPRTACTFTKMGFSAHLRCPIDRQKIQKIHSAIFGVEPLGSCPHYYSDDKSCTLFVKDFIVERCVGLSSCTIPVKPESFGFLKFTKVCKNRDHFLALSAECEEIEPTKSVITNVHDLSTIPIPLYTTFIDPNRYGEYTTNIEMFPNLIGPVGVQRRDKSLIVMAVGKKAISYVNKIVTTLGFEKYSYFFFRYDDHNKTEDNENVSVYSNPYTQFSWFDHVVWLSAKKQSRYWYFKRFVTPEIARSYQFVWFFDDDCDINDLDISDVENIMREWDISIAQISYNTKLGHYGYLPHTLQVESDPNNPHIGRWTTFAEIGPALVFRSSAYQCAWHSVFLDLSCGFGNDDKFVGFCNVKAAIIDKYSVIHRDLRTTTGGKYIDMCFNEMWAMFKRVPNWVEGYFPVEKRSGPKFGPLYKVKNEKSENK